MSTNLVQDGTNWRPRNRGKLLKLYIALLCVVIIAITIAEGYSAYARRDPAIPFDLGDLVNTLIDGRFPLDVLRVLGFAALGLGYFLPLFVADFRGHYDRAAIGLVNAAFGWTIVGWLAAGCWAAMPTKGLRVTLADAKRRSAPAVAQTMQKLGDLGHEAEQHPLVRDAKRKLDRLLSGKLHRYAPPPEGVETLIASWSLVRDIEGGLNLSARLLLPMGTRLSLRITRQEEEVYSTRCVLDSEGWLRVGPISSFGRPYLPGRCSFRLETFPFVFGSQEDWIIDAVGERGTSLPHSATKPADPEFPQHGRKLDVTIVEEIPAPVPETRLIETVKQHRAVLENDATATKSVEELLRDRLAARLEEQPVAAPWSVEQVDTARWIVSFAFTRRGRSHRACWEVDEDTGLVRYRDPEAKALSVG
jgi:hypothetical protein